MIFKLHMQINDQELYCFFCFNIPLNSGKICNGNLLGILVSPL